MERNTRQRTAIREAIAQAARPLLPQEVLAAAQGDAPSLSIATVYRNLKAMQDEGELRTVMLPGENARYELSGGGHHHHFQCLQCQRVFEVLACPGDLSALAPPGFSVEDHDLTLYGRCAECGASQATGRRSPRGRAAAKPAHAAAHDPAQHPAHGHDHGHHTGHDHTHHHTHAPARAAATKRR